MKSFVYSALAATTFAQVDYVDTLNAIDIEDLTSILADYDVADYSQGVLAPIPNYDSSLNDDYTASEAVYEEVGPSDIEFGDYPSGFDEYGATTDDDDSDSSIFENEEDPTERLRPQMFSDFEELGIPEIAALPVMQRFAQTGTGTNAGTSFNFCRVCNGVSAAECAIANTETCNYAQSVCQITVRIKYSGAEPLYFSECQEKHSCERQERQNFISSNKIFNQCRSTRMAPRFANGNKCSFCTKMGGSGGERLIFKDINNADSTTDIQINDGSSVVTIASALEDPENYFEKTGANYIYNKQTWYDDTMN